MGRCPYWEHPRESDLGFLIPTPKTDFIFKSQEFIHSVGFEKYIISYDLN